MVGDRLGGTGDSVRACQTRRHAITVGVGERRLMESFRLCKRRQRRGGHERVERWSVEGIRPTLDAESQSSHLVGGTCAARRQQRLRYEQCWEVPFRQPSSTAVLQSQARRLGGENLARCPPD